MVFNPRQQSWKRPDGDEQRIKRRGGIRGHKYADIATFGDHSQGLRLQSIGGGGAFSASVQEMQIGSTNSSGELSGGDIELITSGSVLTQGSGSVGVGVISLGGGGGSLFGEANDTIWMGTLDENKSGKIVTSNAGDIDINQTGEFITTTGEQAGAIVVMSAAAAVATSQK